MFFPFSLHELSARRKEQINGLLLFVPTTLWKDTYFLVQKPKKQLAIII